MNAEEKGEPNEPNGEAVGGIILGFDFSTQQVKAVAVTADNCSMVANESVVFDNDLPEYRTHGGVNVSGNRVTSPTIMWVKALDILMEKLRLSGVDFSEVTAISGCGQQHGSVYWRNGARHTLQKLVPGRFLHDQLAHAFSVLDSPVWMDSSTGAQCRHLEEALGGPQELANVTGSRAYERFTGNQIAKVFAERGEAYANTDRISLVSSFACSLFIGEYAPICLSDAGGMNLLDIRSHTWSQECLDACAPNLIDKLAAPVPSSTIVGQVSDYMIERYGFTPECQVVAFTGDNPASLAGLRMAPGDVGISLGTSDTLFVWLDNDSPQPQLTGHIWPNPVDHRQYMALLCYKNGSLTRERVCNEAAEGSWDLFNQLLDSTPRGNFGNIGMYFDHPEITPPNLHGDFRFSKIGERVARFASKEAEVRALVEGQFMAKRLHAEKMGFKIGRDSRILVCGGASVNKTILQVIADVFNAPVYTQRAVAHCAALGCAFRARHALLGAEEKVKFSDVVFEESCEAVVACSPHKDANSVYKPLLERFQALEQRILNMA